MATKRTNFARATAWGTDMKVECEGTISSVSFTLFRRVESIETQRKLIAHMQTHVDERAAREAPPPTPAPPLHSEEWWVMLDARKQRILERIAALVKEETADLTPDMDDQLRTQLTEEVRFWR